MKIMRILYTSALILFLSTFILSPSAFSDGTVTVQTVANGRIIKIIGDNEPNCIGISMENNLLLVEGFQSCGNNLPTVVNGSPVDTTGVNLFIVFMNRGSDFVRINLIDTPSSYWNVFGQDDEDVFDIFNTTARSFSINLGRGNDEVIMSNVNVEKKSRANGSQGNDDTFLVESDNTGPFDVVQFERIGFGCFRGDTLIATETGMRPIETIQVGDLVWSWDQTSGKKTLQKVSRTYRKPASGLRIIRVGSESIFTTDAHPYWVEGKGWVKARFLGAGDILRTANGTRLAVVSNDRAGRKNFYAGYGAAQNLNKATVSNDRRGSVRFATFNPDAEPLRKSKDTKALVYNLEIENTHTFFVGKQKVLVHNK